jgi:hypothetical protein
LKVNDRDVAKAALMEKLISAAKTPSKGITIREAAGFLVDAKLYSGENAFHADRAAVHFARGLLTDLYKYRKVKKIERSARRGGDIYYLPT